MARTRFDETERLIIERWEDVAALLEATDAVKRKIGDFIEDSEDRLKEWAKTLDFQAGIYGGDGDIVVYRPHWAKRDDVKLALSFGGLTAKCVLELDDSKPYSGVWTPGLKSLGIDRSGRERLRDELKRHLGVEFAAWDQDTDNEWLLSKYLDIDGEAMRQALLGRDAFVDFVTGQLKPILPLADVLDTAMQAVRGRTNAQPS